jgi:hypothetical protein
VNRTFDIDPAIRAKVQASMVSALSMAKESMPKEMREFAEKRALVMENNSNQNSYIAVDDIDDSSNLHTWVTQGEGERARELQKDEKMDVKKESDQRAHR